jgi:hypothetical protein
MDDLCRQFESICKFNVLFLDFKINKTSSVFTVSDKTRIEHSYQIKKQFLDFKIDKTSSVFTVSNKTRTEHSYQIKNSF